MKNGRNIEEILNAMRPFDESAPPNVDLTATSSPGIIRGPVSLVRDAVVLTQGSTMTFVDRTVLGLSPTGRIGNLPQGDSNVVDPHACF